jgi:hypothetical protein
MMDAVPSMAPTTRTGAEPSTVAGAPIGLTLSASWDRGASDLVDNQARRALAEIIVPTGLGIPTDGAPEGVKLVHGLLNRAWVGQTAQDAMLG